MVRLIPAQAGKTSRNRGCAHSDSAHPRAGGENRLSVSTMTSDGGSSPRRRGKHIVALLAHCAFRLIPAQAGKTWVRRWWGRRAPAHPRAGGENADVVNLYRMSTGSSPRRRGKRRPLEGRLVDNGLIPAQAGKTTRSLPGFLRRWAHPRAGGENGKTQIGSHAPLGSSPRRRGKHPVNRLPMVVIGLIPAQAGKTLPRCGSTQSRTAHPRAGGENVHVDVVERLLDGSSPRRRGKPNQPRG